MTILAETDSRTNGTGAEPMHAASPLVLTDQEARMLRHVRKHHLDPFAVVHSLTLLREARQNQELTAPDAGPPQRYATADAYVWKPRPAPWAIFRVATLVSDQPCFTFHHGQGLTVHDVLDDLAGCHDETSFDVGEGAVYEVFEGESPVATIKVERRADGLRFESRLADADPLRQDDQGDEPEPAPSLPMPRPAPDRRPARFLIARLAEAGDDAQCRADDREDDGTGSWKDIANEAVRTLRRQLVLAVLAINEYLDRPEQADEPGFTWDRCGALGCKWLVTVAPFVGPDGETDHDPEKALVSLLDTANDGYEDLDVS